MSKFPTARVSGIAAGLAMVSALAAAPISAQAAETELAGTLSAGSLSNTAPTIASFTAELTGLTQTVHTSVGAWSVTDATGSDAGYNVTVAASEPTVAGSAAGAGTEGSITLTPTAATAAEGNPASTGPVAQTPQTLSTTASTIDSAAKGTGEGDWNVAADSADNELAVVIPGNASAGAYSSTLTFTTAPLVA